MARPCKHSLYRNRHTYLHEQNVPLVPKLENPPNLPQCRPIEEFWAICKQEYKKLKKTPKDLPAFKRVWTRISNQVAEKHGFKLMKGLHQKVNMVGRKGVKQATEDGDI